MDKEMCGGGVRGKGIVAKGMRKGTVKKTRCGGGEESRLWANGFRKGEEGRGLWRKGCVEEERESDFAKGTCGGVRRGDCGQMDAWRGGVGWRGLCRK